MTRGRLKPACETITLKLPPSRECNSHLFGHCSSRLGRGLLETMVRPDFCFWRQSGLAIMMATPSIGIVERDPYPLHLYGRKRVVESITWSKNFLWEVFAGEKKASLFQLLWCAWWVAREKLTIIRKKKGRDKRPMHFNSTKSVPLKLLSLRRRRRPLLGISSRSLARSESP